MKKERKRKVCAERDISNPLKDCFRIFMKVTCEGNGQLLEKWAVSSLASTINRKPVQFIHRIVKEPKRTQFYSSDRSSCLNLGSKGLLKKI